MSAVDPAYLSSQPSAASKPHPQEPVRNKAYDPKKPHITETPMTKKNWYKHVNWLNVILIVGIPMCGLVAAYWTPLYTVCGRTLPTLPASRSRSSSLLLVAVPLKVPSDGGPATTALTTATPTPTRTPTASGRDFSTLTSAGCS
jgi:hypothetical protein